VSEKPQEPGLTDSDELGRFYRLFFLPLVRRAVRRHGMSFDDAGDIVQDAFVIAVGKLDPSKNPKAWLYQVVDHLAVNFQRKELRRSRLAAKWHPSSGVEGRFREAQDEQ
jgi:DNA-directed RNA polymerase specialized sigma24 family protein